MAVQDHIKRYPFDFAIANRKLSLATLKHLLELFPDAVANGNTLCRAMMRDLPLDLLQTMVDDWPTNKTCLTFRYAGAQALTLAQTRLICQLFPKLKTLTLAITAAAWEVPACAYFLKQLQNNQTIVGVEYLTLPAIAGESKERQEEILNDFQLLLETNHTIKKLIGHVSEDTDINVSLKWLRSMDRAISNSPNNSALEVLQFATSAANLCVNSKRNSALPTPFRIGNIEEGQEEERHNHGQRLGLCLSIWSADEGDDNEDILATVLPSIPDFASFAEVRIGCNSYQRLNEEAQPMRDITNEIVALVGENRFFQHLHCSGYKVDPFKICEALRGNTSLLGLELYLDRDSGGRQIQASSGAIDACVSLLKEHNVTLIHFKPMEAASPKIQYYLDLNRLGRTIARSLTEGEAILELLLNVREDEGLKTSTEQWENRVHSMVYGLLSEAPDSWCLPALLKKRKDHPW